MFSSYFISYLIFVVVVSLLLSLAFFKIKLSALRVILPVIALIFIFPLLLGYVYITYFSSIPEVVVPDLSGKTIESAAKELAALRLRSRHAGSVYDMNYPEGLIVSQNPEKGRRVKIGRSVALITSSGKQKVVVPNLLGRPEVQAEAVLAAKGLQVGKIAREVVGEVDPGTILAQNPLPGEEVEVATLVHITVTVSPEPEAVSKEAEGGFKLW